MTTIYSAVIIPLEIVILCEYSWVHGCTLKIDKQNALGMENEYNQHGILSDPLWVCSVQ